MSLWGEAFYLKIEWGELWTEVANCSQNLELNQLFYVFHFIVNIF